LRNGNVWSVIQDRRGIVRAGTWDGAYELAGDKFVGLSDGQTIGWDVLAMYEDSAANLWLGQQAFGGITRLCNSNRTVIEIPGKSAHLDVRCFVEDRDHNLWIGTSEDGLYQMKDGKFTHFDRKDGLGSDSIWSLFVDGQGVLWVGACRGGLSHWQNGHFVTWTTKNGLINNVICQILEDAHANLWLGSYGGVFRIDRSELNESFSNPNREVHCVGYGLEDGLPSLECQGGFQPSGYKSRDGSLWFPTIKGLVMVNPEKVGRNSLPPAVVIEDVIVDGTSNSETNRAGQSSIGLSAKSQRSAGQQPDRIPIYGFELLGAERPAFQIPFGGPRERMGGRRNKALRRLQPCPARKLCFPRHRLQQRRSLEWNRGDLGCGHSALLLANKMVSDFKCGGGTGGGGFRGALCRKPHHA
jgi:ligand-binding sensor domain-containing protein